MTNHTKEQDPLAAGIERLRQAEEDWLDTKTGAAEVAAAKAALAPDVERATRVVREVSAFQARHGASLQRLAGTNWRALRMQGAHEFPLGYLERSVVGTVTLMHAAITDLSKIPARVSGITYRLMRFEIPRIRETVKTYEGVPADLEERLAKIQMWVVEVQGQLDARHGTAPLPSEPHILAPLPDKPLTDAVTEFSVFQEEK